MSYNKLALIYDSLMEDTDYNRWADYLIWHIERNQKISGKVLLDLGCGTGNLLIPLAKKGFKVIGVDISTDMLTQAEQKIRENDLSIPLLQQDIRNLTLDRSTDVVISTFDTLNYILELKELTKVFKNVNNILNYNGLFIFDLNSEFKFSSVLGENIFTYNTEQIVYIWENSYDRETKICYMDLTFFILDEIDGKYLRFSETHIQKAYTQGEITKILAKTGFELLGVYGELSFSEPQPQEEKIFFVARKC